MNKANGTDLYYEHMYVKTDSRDFVWTVLADYFQRDIPAEASVLDLGAGYCGFINSIHARKKWAADISIHAKAHAAADVNFLVTPSTDLSPIPSGTLDCVFASNLFEHLTSEETAGTLMEVRRVLRPGGRLLILQPNFSFAFREYFHDFTHKTIYTHVGLSDLMETNHFHVVRCVPRLVPMSMQKKYGGFSIPNWKIFRFLIRLYLALPLKPFAKQMYLVCEKTS